MTPRPQPVDGYLTPTTQTQAETEEVLMMHIPSTDASETVLNKNPHMQFLIRNFIQGFPPKYTSQDASQPWLMFWTIQAFSTLQVALDPGNKQRSGSNSFFVVWMRGLTCDYDGTKSNRNDYGMATPRRWIWRRVWPVGSSSAYICCNLFSRDCRASWSWWGMGPDRQVNKI